MSKLQLISPTHSEKVAGLKQKFKGIELPEGIREDESHLIHLLSIKSVADPVNFDYIHTAHIIKLNEEAYAATKDNLAQYSGEIHVLHDGRQYIQEQAAEAEKAKQKAEQDAKEAKEKAEKQAQEQAAEAEKTLQEKDAEIAELKKLLEQKGNSPKENNEDPKTIKGNGKG